jgi:hypothetical protein
VLIDPETGVSKKDAEGNAVITKLNETILLQLAQISNGAYVKMEDVDEAVNKVIAQLDKIDQKALHDVAYLNYQTFFQWFVGMALLFLVGEFFIPERKKLSLEIQGFHITRYNLLVQYSLAQDQKPEPEIYKGNELYKKQQFNKAAEAYQRPFKKSK